MRVNVLAQSCLWSRQYDCALAEFRSILTVNPDAVQAHMLMAEALDDVGKTADAIKELEEADRIAPNEPILMACQFVLAITVLRHLCPSVQ